jgi:ferric-dicitrate binding protein FerR (iron transport regulator)
MADSQRDDVIWQTAIEWIIRKHESPLEAAAENELAAWLKKDPSNRAAYEEASHLWLLAGLVPRSDESE